MEDNTSFRDSGCDGIIDRFNRQEPTPIQKRIEYAVTNGRGYLEKDERNYESSLFRFQMSGYQRHPNPQEIAILAEELGAKTMDLNPSAEDWLEGYVVIKDGRFVFNPFDWTTRGVRR